jgi:sugar lactone lactonase YvrE
VPLSAAANLNDLCGESPIWDFRSRRLLWTDIPRNVIHELTPETGGIASRLLSISVSGIALNGENELVVCGGEGLFLVRAHEEPIRLHSLAAPLNDMIIGPNGMLYAGTFFWDNATMEKTGELWVISPGGEASVIDDGIELANGLGFSPDNRTLYFTDSAARKIYAYDVAAHSGVISGKRVLVRIPSEEGIPDGLTVDAEGFIWSAQWYGSQVVRYDPEGKVQQRMEIPARQVSSVAFGGADLSTLFITTASEVWESPFAPANHGFTAGRAGGPLFAVKVDVPGKPEHIANFSHRRE